MQVFVEPMLNTPSSGFALYGLTESLKSLNRTADAAQIAEVYKEAWKSADGPLDSPCPAFSRHMKSGLGQGRRRLLA